MTMESKHTYGFTFLRSLKGLVDRNDPKFSDTRMCLSSETSVFSVSVQLISVRKACGEMGTYGFMDEGIQGSNLLMQNN